MVYGLERCINNRIRKDVLGMAMYDSINVGITLQYPAVDVAFCIAADCAIDRLAICN